MDKLPESYRSFQQHFADVWQAYETLGSTAAQSGPLDPKTRRLVKLSMAAAQGAESAVHSHTHRALAIGVTPEELEHSMLLGVTTMGFPRMMTALSWVKDAIADHQSP